MGGQGNLYKSVDIVDIKRFEAREEVGKGRTEERRGIRELVNWLNG